MSSLGAVPLLIAAAVVVVEAARAAASVRRARRLSRAMHELRRPLQALSLIVERGVADPEAGMACMARAREALSELEAVVERTPSRRRREGPLDEVLARSQAQWRAAGVDVEAIPPGRIVRDPELLGAAIDNLVANALEHGRRPVSLHAEVTGDTADVVVRDAGAIEPRERRRRDPRRGHGLKVVRDYARRTGGSAELGIGPGQNTAARISIPVTRPSEEPRGAER